MTELRVGYRRMRSWQMGELHEGPVLVVRYVDVLIDVSLACAFFYIQ